MKRLVEAGKKAPLILCPSHKSHIDYMILSMICDDYGLQPPHVAAGDNLNFWPVGRLLRAGGAFFIRRSFKGDRIYSATMVLRSKYGRITIRAGEPISLAQLFRERGVDPETCTPEEKKKIVQHLGWKIAAGINAAAPLAPTGLAAAVLLSHDRRALSETELLDRAEFLHMAAVDNGAHGGTEPIRPLVLNAVESLCADGTLKRHEAGGERFYAVPEERRIALDYHKNGILHFLVAPAILAAALRSFRGKPAPHAELLRRARDASRLLKYEFIFPPGKTLESTVDETFALLLRWGLVERVGEAVQPVAPGLRMLSLLAELLRPF